MSFLDFGGDLGGIGNSLGGMQLIGGGSKKNFGAWDSPPGTIGGPNTGGKSQSQGAPGQFGQAPQIPNAAGMPGLGGTQSGVNQPGSQIVKDRLGFSQKPRSQDMGVMPIPTSSNARPQKIGQNGAALGGQPMMSDLRQSPIQQQPGGKLSFMDTLKKVESAGGKQTRNTASPSHVGAYQMNQSAFKRFNPGGDINNEADQLKAATAYTEYNRSSLKSIMGRDPSDAEVYLSYNQGLHGAHQLLSNPDKPAGSVVNPQNIVNQGGNPQAPSSLFTKMMSEKFNAAAGGTDPTTQINSGMTRGINPDAFASPASMNTKYGAQQTGSTDQLITDMNRDAAAAGQLRSPPDMGEMEGQ